MTHLGAGQRLREIRERLHLTLKDVEAHSRHIAQARHNPQYLFTAGRLSQIENSNSLPSIYKLATLSEVYRLPYLELLHLFEIEAADDSFTLTVQQGQPEHPAPDPEVRPQEVPVSRSHF